jgi:hypothetical protein
MDNQTYIWLTSCHIKIVSLLDVVMIAANIRAGGDINIERCLLQRKRPIDRQ